MGAEKELSFKLKINIAKELYILTNKILSLLAILLISVGFLVIDYKTTISKTKPNSFNKKFIIFTEDQKSEKKLK